MMPFTPALRAGALALVFLATAASPSWADSLPSSWHGTWSGECADVQPGANPDPFKMTLEVEPDRAEGVTWTTTFNRIGSEPIVKEYRLEPTEFPGRFVMKQPNGIVLDTTLVHDSLYQLFFLPDNKLQMAVRFTRTGEGITTEITTHTTSRPRPHEVPGVARLVSFQLTGVQRCQLDPMSEQ